MEKIDRRHIYGIMIDTETANTLTIGDKLDMSSVLPYDIGFKLIDSHGRDYGHEYSFINSEIFDKEKELMNSSYYAKKIPRYYEDLEKGLRIRATPYEIRKAFHDLYNKYNCRFACAHNARFDNISLNNMMRWDTKSKYRYFFPYGCVLWDTMKMADDVICKMPTYIRFCQERNYLTSNGKPRKTAGILYQFISGQTDFEESHTGLEDVNIEREILAYCVKQKKAMRKTLYNSPFETWKSTDFQIEVMKNIKDFPILSNFSIDK